MALGGCVLVLSSCRKDVAGPDPLPVESRFSQNAEHWSTVGDGLMSHISTGGNPGGFVQMIDQVNGPSMYFVAPARYYGDRSDALGRLLTFELRWASGVDPSEQPDRVSVILQGGGLTLVAFFANGPGPDWTPYSLRLDATGGWVQDGGNTPATAADIQQVLGSLQQIRIRAEYNEGQETTGLDNVVFGLQG